MSRTRPCWTGMEPAPVRIFLVGRLPFLTTNRRPLSSRRYTNPQKLGYGFSTWSSVRLAEHLAKVTGIRFGDDQLRRLLHKHGFSFHRPKHTLKGKRDEAAHDKAAKQLRRLKKKR